MIMDATASFLFAPVVYWFSCSSPIVPLSDNSQQWSVHNSLSCVAFGFGDTYGGFSITSSYDHSIQSTFELSYARPMIPL